MQSDYLETYDDECQVFNAAKDWLIHDKKNREPFAAEIMSNVRFHTISGTRLGKFMERIKSTDADDVFKEFIMFIAQIQAALEFAEEDNFKKPLVTIHNTSARGKEGFIIAKTFRAGDTLNFKFLSLSNRRSWESMSPISFVEESWNAVRLNSFMFIFAIKDSKNERSSRGPVTLRYDANFDTWVELKPFPQGIISGPAVAQLDGHIFYIGGAHQRSTADQSYYSGSDDLTLRYLQLTNKVGKYQIESNQWFQAKSLPQRICNAAAVGCPTDGRVYLTGGQKKNAEETQIADDVYAYLLEGGIWIARPPMITHRSHHFMECIGEKLYVVGGKSKKFKSKLSVEQYHVTHEQWSYVKLSESIDITTRMGFTKGNNLYLLNSRETAMMIMKGKPRNKETFNILKIDTLTLILTIH